MSCQRERERGKNRFIALRTLIDKIERHMRGDEDLSEEEKAVEKRRKQKARRKRRAKSAQSGEQVGASANDDEEGVGGHGDSEGDDFEQDNNRSESDE